MCGRYTLTTPVETVAEVFGVQEFTDLRPRYNIAPTQEVAVVGRNQEGSRTLGTMRWGLVPHWAKDISIGNRMINARSETVAEKPAFRSSFKRKRCLLPADGFYEWKKLNGKKQPYYARRKDQAPFAFAGIWARWRPKTESTDNNEEGPVIQSCALLTTEPNDVMRDIHDRMPVILPADAWDLWLDPEPEDVDALTELLRPYDPEVMEAYAVSTLVNRPGNDSPRCIEPLGADDAAEAPN